MAASPRTSRTTSATGSRRSGRSSDQAAQGSQRRQALVEIAAELFAERGFRSTTVREIGDAAGVLSGSLYHHFDSKETIIDEILTSYLDNLMETYRDIVAREEDPTSTLRQLIVAAFVSLGPHRAAITVIQNERNYLSQFPRFAYLTKAETDVRRIWVKVIQDGIADGVFRDDLDPIIAYRFLRDSVWVAVRWFTPSGKLSAEQLADQYLRLVLEGLQAGRQR
ncbi:TetR/AcrR family transcriptional regulator [Rhodococcoides kyotonense]|uniref:DNA-binding transcriptional regulator, AcrR family n=1 Tax=Rhodococcoides kyotonense TaxID=398843 RepID=A0A239JVD1_9NOCA|nr:TetR/AcrR family transcriptional regulator [Rhodococcus kyotonensis]SNT09502.1 DNA-binding transcriptional regulator, AcrR family [Rhodococcus kyotonensis]